MKRYLILLILLLTVSLATAGTQYINTQGSNLSLGSSDLLFLDNTNGRVGLGTVSPSSKLTVGGSDSSTVQASTAMLNIFNSDTTVNNYASIAFGQSGTGPNSFSRIGVQYKDRTGSSEDQDIFFATIGAGAYGERVRINSIGNVGIGASSPDYKLEISASDTQAVAISNANIAHGITAQAQTDVGAVYGVLSTTAGGALIQGISDTDAEGVRIEGFIGATDPTDTTPAIRLNTGKKVTTNVGAIGSTETVLSVDNIGSPLVTVLGSGNMGIGTTSPEARLQIGDSTASTANRIVFGKYEAASQSYTPVIQHRSIIVPGTSNDLALGARSASGGIVFYTGATLAGSGALGGELGTSNSAIRMTITSDGKVGIGDSSPTNILDVAGAIGISDTTVIDASRNWQGNAIGVTKGGTGLTTISANQAIYGSGANTITAGTLPVAAGGTGRTTSTTAYGLIAAGTTATGAHQTLATGTAGQILRSGGAAALPAWSTATYPATAAANQAIYASALNTITAGTLPVAAGGTGLTASVEDAVMVGSGTTTWQAKALPASCAGATSKLLYDSTTNAFSCGTDANSGGTMSSWLLAASNTAGTQSITNGVLVNITAGTGISATRSGSVITITNTGDTNAADDLTTGTAFSGDVSGAYNNLQLGTGVVGTTEIADDSITDNDLAYNTGQHLTTSSTPAFAGLSLTGSSSTTSGSVATYENVVQYYPGSTPSTGTIVIKIGSTPNMMIDAEISVQGYDGVHKYHVRGYTYTGSTNWHQPVASCSGSGVGSCSVRFGKDTATGERVIMLGITTTSWGSYPHVVVNRVSRGYPGSGGIGTWSISIVTDESAYTVGTTPNINSGFVAYNPSFTGSVTIGGDTALTRGAANRLDLASGDSLNLVSGSIQIAATNVIDSSRNWAGNAIAVNKGGTGLTTVAANNALYASALNTITAGTLPVAAGGTGATAAAGARTNLGATTVGSNLFTLTNPTAVTFLRVNADNTVSALDAATFRSAIGAGTGTMSSFTLAGTSGTPQSITEGNTLTIAAGTGISTTAGATDTVTITNTGDTNAADDLTTSTTWGGDLTGTGASPTIAANAVALTTDTTGNYVATVSAGTGISVTGADGEGITKTVALTTDYQERVDFSQARSQSQVSGGGSISWNTGTSTLTWGARFIWIPVDKSMSTNGYFELAASSAVLPAWRGLYAACSAGSVSCTAQTRDYNAADGDMDNWFLVAYRNGDTNQIVFADGTTMNAAQSNTIANLGSFNGDITGTRDNLQIGSGVVGDTELASTTVAANSYGDSITVPTFTVNTDGRLTAASGTTIRSGTTAQTGVLQLTDSIASTSTTTAATPNSVKTAYDLASSANSAAAAKASPGNCPAGQVVMNTTTSGVQCVAAGLSGGLANKMAYWTGTSSLSYNTNLHWDNTNTRLGIGTATPQTGLVLSTGSALIKTSHDSIATATTWTNIGSEEGIYISYDAANDRGRIASVHSGTAYRDLSIVGQDISFATDPAGSASPTERMTITGAGNVGIGTTTPSEKLHVAGNVKAEGCFAYEGVTGLASITSLSLSTIQDVSFINTTMGWVISSVGLVAKTTDGGLTWSHVGTAPGGTTYYAISFVSSTTGWVVGSNGRIYKTTDGGASWTQQTSGTTYTLVDVFFLDSNTGWAGGYNASGGNSYGHLLRTTNGGTSWSIVNIGDAIGADAVYSVHFADANTGWMVWYNHPGTGFGNYYTAKTTNGGTGWTNQLSISQMTSSLSKVFTANSTVAYAIGGGGRVHKTSDGTNWVQQTSNTTNQVNAIAFADTNNGWFFAQGTIGRTTNGGTNWYTQNSGVVMTNAAALNSSTAVATGSAKIYKTTDGTTWSGTYSDKPANIRATHRVNSTVILVAANDGVYRSIDSGNTWSQAKASIIINDFHFISDTTGWAVGNSGAIYKTTDGGASWTQQTSGTANTLQAVQFLDANTGWIIGTNSYLKTTNGGTTWSYDTASFTSWTDMHFVNSSHGWRISSGSVHSTTNGGTSWAATGAVTNGYNIYFLNSTVGWALGQQAVQEWDGAQFATTYYSAIYYTTNGGTSWVMIYSAYNELGAAAGLSKMFFVNGTTKGYIAGSGFILSTTSGLDWTKTVAPGADNLVDIHVNEPYSVAVSTSNILTLNQGTLSLGTCADIAELYDTDEALEPGDIVYTKGGLNVGKASPGDTTRVLGVYSTSPAIMIEGGAVVMGGLDAVKEGKAAVALTGRVPVKVTNENGAIQPGDRLTLSKTMPGHAMKLLGAGTSIGIALETYQPTGNGLQTGKAMMFVSNSYIAGQGNSGGQINSDGGQKSASDPAVLQRIDHLEMQLQKLQGKDETPTKPINSVGDVVVTVN